MSDRCGRCSTIYRFDGVHRESDSFECRKSVHRPVTGRSPDGPPAPSPAHTETTVQLKFGSWGKTFAQLLATGNLCGLGIFFV